MKELVPAPHFHYLLHPYSTCLVGCCNEEGGVRALDRAWPLLHIGGNLFTGTRDKTVEPQLPA